MNCSGAFCLEPTHADKGTPPSIKNAFVQSCFGTSPIGKILPLLILFGFRGFTDVRDGQVFKDDYLIGINQLPTLLMQEIVSLVSNFPMDFGYLFLGFLSSMTSSFA
jgi:hypothetical protein